MAGRNGEMHALQYKWFTLGTDKQGNELIIIKFKRTKTTADSEDQKAFVTSPLEVSIIKRYLQLWKVSNDSETTVEFFKSVRVDSFNNIIVGKQNIGFNTLSNFNKNIALYPSLPIDWVLQQIGDLLHNFPTEAITLDERQ